ncbi:MAG: GNAT family N-acetyltransferase [Candidatus Cryptobacteroides sp.]
MDLICKTPKTNLPGPELRAGIPSDAGFIATTVMAAMGKELGYEDIHSALTWIASMEDTLYSYRNTHVAVCGDEIAGAIIGYDGARYAELADRTFTLLAERLGTEKLSPGTETGPGEYYLDSLYVNPLFRGRSVGSLLMRDELEVAEGLGFTTVSLLVDREKPWLHKLYSRLGFRMDGEVLFFGELFFRMVQDI